MSKNPSTTLGSQGIFNTIGSQFCLFNLTHFLHTARLLQLLGAYRNNDSVLNSHQR